jgi:hypothetical protein
MSQQGDRKVTIELKGVADGDDDDKTVPGVQPGRAVGFRAKLAGVSLWDLVQMECLAGSRMVVLVTGEGGIGYLYFDRGQIVHALTTEHTGEEAALEILGWTNGSFQPCERPWPEARTILTSHEALILEVARRQDEASNLVAFPTRPTSEPARPAAAGGEPFDEVEMFDFEEEGAPPMADTRAGGAPPQPAPPPGRAEFLSADYAVMLRLGPHGAIVKNDGGTEEQAEMAAYVRRLLELAGDFLGLEGFGALECTFTKGRCLAFVDTNGDTVVLRPRAEANLQPLRERLGLL